MYRKIGLAAIMLLTVAPALAGEIASGVDARLLPEAKRTPLGLYLTPTEAQAALSDDPGIVFLDVRDPLEVSFVGHAEGTDAVVPIKMASRRFDPKRGSYAMDPNPDFVAEVKAVVEREGKGRDDPIFVMCRSGPRAAAAAAKLAAAGYTNVWSLVEGFEGDRNKETGVRDVNGWRNAGLPWSYKLDPETAWQPAAK